MWTPISKNLCKSFALAGEPEVVHIIKTGFKDRYMAVGEDAFEQVLGNVEFGTKSEIENRYKINLDEL